MNWFDVDKSGLAALLENRGKSFALFELISNAWDANPSEVIVKLEPIPNSPYATLTVEDDSEEGWLDLSQAFTIFSRSNRGSDAVKRGRFCLGEKLVLSLYRSAKIVSTTGTITFDEGPGRRQSKERRDRGTLFTGEIRMTRDELAQVESDISRVISPPTTITIFNGKGIFRPEKTLKMFEAKLPTVIADADGNLRPSIRFTKVEAFASDEGGEILEMGIPVCAADWPWRLNVLQKVPLGMDRDSVTGAFRRSLQVAAMNVMADTLDSDSATAPWANEAIEDARIAPDALKHVVTQRFGERAVVAVPGDPLANANAEATGCTVVHGGALSSGAWANIRKHTLIPTASQAFPTAKPSFGVPANSVCPTCGQLVDK